MTQCCFVFSTFENVETNKVKIIIIIILQTNKITTTTKQTLFNKTRQYNIPIFDKIIFFQVEDTTNQNYRNK